LKNLVFLYSPIQQPWIKAENDRQDGTGGLKWQCSSNFHLFFIRIKLAVR